MMEEDHYDTPWEFLQRPGSVRLSAADIRVPDLRPSPNASPTMPHSPSFSNHLVHIGNNSPSHDTKRLSLRMERTKLKMDIRNEKDALLEKGIDRVEAEKRLESLGNLGDFVLRYRNEGSAALSLRGSSSILHIKLERRGDKWIVGEGPCFKSIGQAIHYYRRHPLPIRGAEHILLNNSITKTANV